MKGLTCDYCGAETTNGLALCTRCQAGVRVHLGVLPVYFRNLARWRPGRSGARQVPGSRVLYDGTERTGGDRIGDLLEETHTSLATWADALVDDRPTIAAGPRPRTHFEAMLARDLPDEETERLVDDRGASAALLCAGLLEHLTSMATLPWVGEFVTDVSDREARLRELTETLVPGWYAGGCQRCGASTYAVPGLSWVTCRSCGDTTPVGVHSAAVLDEARDWVAPPKELAQAVVALVDSETSVRRVYDRIRQWADRGRITAHHHLARDYVYDEGREAMVVADVEVGRARYRLGDVLERVTRAS